jgi:hypothetical protein
MISWLWRWFDGGRRTAVVRSTILHAHRRAAPLAGGRAAGLRPHRRIRALDAARTTAPRPHRRTQQVAP